MKPTSRAMWTAWFQRYGGRKCYNNLSFHVIWSMNHSMHATHRSAWDKQLFFKSRNDQKQRFSPNMRINHSVHVNTPLVVVSGISFLLTATSEIPVVIFPSRIDLDLRPRSIRTLGQIQPGISSVLVNKQTVFPAAEKIPATIFQTFLLTEAQPRSIWRAK